MNDSISRQAALNECLELAEARQNWETAEGQAEIRGIDAVMCALHDLPPAQRWIPVTEKPIASGQYIVTLKDDKGVWTDIAEWNPTFGGRWEAEFFDCEYRDIDNVVAWMPFPEPWGGESDGQ